MRLLCVFFTGGWWKRILIARQDVDQLCVVKHITNLLSYHVTKVPYSIKTKERVKAPKRANNWS